MHNKSRPGRVNGVFSPASSWVRYAVTGCVAPIVVGATGCTPQLSPVSSHTLRVAENQDADVVWVDYDEVLMRCSNTAQGPVCIRAKQ